MFVSASRQLALNFVVSAGYGILHALLLFVHVVTMFVAVNSSDQVSFYRHLMMESVAAFQLSCIRVLHGP